MKFGNIFYTSLSIGFALVALYFAWNVIKTVVTPKTAEPIICQKIVDYAQAIIETLQTQELLTTSLAPFAEVK